MVNIWHRMARLAPVFCAALLAAVPARADLVWTPDGGWKVQGGILAPFVGEVAATPSSLDAMNKAKAAQEAGSYWTALNLYDRVIKDDPSSVLAPEALFQKGLIYIKRQQWEKAYDSFSQIITRYPDYPRFNAVIGQEYQVASLIQQGKRPMLWGWFPWFRNYNHAIQYYQSVVTNAPYSEYAPLALMNIAAVARKQLNKPEVAIDALDQLKSNYPQSMLAPDAYLELGDTYRNLVGGAAYDQGYTRQAIQNYDDYLRRFPTTPEAKTAQARLVEMTDTYARSKLILGDFYYYYRNSNRAALIFYNEAITLAPDSPAATQAKVQIDKIRRNVRPPMTPYDWVFGRYKEPTLLAYEEQSQVDNLAAETFQVQATDSFLETPGTEVVETINSQGQAQTYEGLGDPGMYLEPGVPAPPADTGFLTPVELPQGAGPAPGTEPGGRPLLR